jgi:UMF1 family MFS transporter
MYTFSFSVLVQALTIITMSGAADHGRFRKTLLLSFAFVGSFATMCFLPVHSGVFWVGAILAIISNTCIGASFVLLNAFLPVLVRHHPEVLAANAEKEGESEDNMHETYDGATMDDDHDLEPASSAEALLGSSNKVDTGDTGVPSPTTVSPELQRSTKISSRGISIGYASSILVQILSVGILYQLGQSTFSLRVVIFFVGLWWALWTIPCIFWLRPRPGPPLHMAGTKSNVAVFFTYMGDAWRSVGKTIARARRLRDVLTFLCAWFLLSDAIATVSGTAVLYAKTTLGMKPAALALINVVVMFSGVIGALTWRHVSRAFGLRPAQTIIACLAVFECIPLYALLGYIPAVQRLGYLGLQQPWEMYPIAFVYGLALGGLSSYCRALYGELIPAGFEATFYSLYAITDKGSSIFGPAIVGAITDTTGDIRPAFWFLAALIAAPIPLMWLVNVQRGKQDGLAMARDLDVATQEEHRADQP